MTRRGIRVGSLAPDVLAERLSAAIEDAYDWESTGHQRINGEVPAWELEGVVSAWAYRLEKAFIRWGCDDDDCPGRPGWEKALDEALSGDHEQLKEQMADVMRAWLAERLMAFAAAHPEARLA